MVYVVVVAVVVVNEEELSGARVMLISLSIVLRHSFLTSVFACDVVTVNVVACVVMTGGTVCADLEVIWVSCG